jgi:hypothetical protein
MRTQRWAPRVLLQRPARGAWSAPARCMPYSGAAGAAGPAGRPPLPPYTAAMLDACRKAGSAGLAAGAGAGAGAAAPLAGRSCSSARGFFGAGSVPGRAPVRFGEKAWQASRGAHGLAARCRHCGAAQTRKLGRSTGPIITAGLAERAPRRTFRQAGRPRALAPAGGPVACAGAAPKPGGTLTGAPKPAAPPPPSRSSSERLGLAASAVAPAGNPTGKRRRVLGNPEPSPGATGLAGGRGCRALVRRGTRATCNSRSGDLQPHDHRACLQPRHTCSAWARAPAPALAGGAAGARRSRLLPRPTTPRLTTDPAPAAAAPAAPPAAQQHRDMLGLSRPSSDPSVLYLWASCGRPLPARSWNSPARSSWNSPARGAPD